MRTKGTEEIAYLLMVPRRTVQYRCERLNFIKEGRDYRLTEEQILEVQTYPMTHKKGPQKSLDKNLTT